MPVSYTHLDVYKRQALDSSRFKYFLSQALGCNANEVEGMVIGGHGAVSYTHLRTNGHNFGSNMQSKLFSDERTSPLPAK